MRRVPRAPANPPCLLSIAPSNRTFSCSKRQTDKMGGVGGGGQGTPESSVNVGSYWSCKFMHGSPPGCLHRFAHEYMSIYVLGNLCAVTMCV